MKKKKKTYSFFTMLHCVKSVCAPNLSVQYFPTFGPNTERYGVSLRIQSKRGKIRTIITPNRDIFSCYVSPDDQHYER